MKNKFKSVGAVLAGFITILILASVTDKILESLGVFPSVEDQLANGFNEGWMQWLTLAYRFLYGIVGGYVTARLAPGWPMRHVLALAVIGTVLGTIAVSVTANLGIFPLWYSIALVVVGLPSIWLGGKWFIRTSPTL